MTPVDLRDLYRYSEWANGRLLAVAASLSPEELERDLGGSFPTVRAVVAHGVSAEWIWLERWSGRSPSAPPAWVGQEPLPGLLERLRDLEARRAPLLAELTAEQLEQTLEFRLLNGTPGALRLQDLLVHVVNHATYHRGQLAAMLRRLGRDVPGTDFLVYCREVAR